METAKSYTFTANSTKATLVFCICTDWKHNWYIDDVKAVAVSTPNVSLLINGDFEYGNSTGWNLQGYYSPCPTPGGVITSVDCRGNSCYSVDKSCQDYQFLQQSFMTTIGQKYSVFFYLKIIGNGGGQVSKGQFGIV